MNSAETGPQNPVEKQYSEYSYPEPGDDIPAWLKSWSYGCYDPSVYEALHWPEGRPKESLEVLVAGCGTMQAAVLAFNNPDCKITGIDFDGGYAEYALARTDFVFPLPTTLDDLHAAPLLCAGIIGFRSLRVAGVKYGDRVGLFGFGASAHLAIEVLRAWRCEVYVSTRGASHRKLAESMGATWVGSESDRPPVALDRAVTFAPSGDVVVLALSSLRKGGVVAINAIHLDRIPEFDYDRLLWGERQIRSVANMTRADARDFLNLAAEIQLRPKVTTFSLDQANKALAAIKSDSIDGAAVIVP